MHDNLTTLYQRYQNSFTTTWHVPSKPLVYLSGNDSFVIAQQDTLHQDTIGESNTTRIYEDLNGEFPAQVHETSRAYVHDVYVRVEDLIDNDELAERVLEIMEELDNYPIFDEGHYSDLETERLMEYIENELPLELSIELGIDEVDYLKAWIYSLDNNLYEFNDGSVDDAPFNVGELADEYRYEHGIGTV